jgi:uncharacterized protein (DUF736 family)
MREGQGSLFRNELKDSDKQPDYRGSLMIGGKVWEIAGWKKEGKKGTFLSLKAQEQRQQDKPKGAHGLESDIPFN